MLNSRAVFDLRAKSPLDGAFKQKTELAFSFFDAKDMIKFS